MAGITVEQHRRRPDEQARHQVVPHHPARGREPEEAVAGPEVAVQGEHLVVLDEDAPVAVDDRLGQAGRARRVEDVERVVERQGLELGRGAAARSRAGRPEQVVPQHGTVVAGGLGFRLEVRHRHRRPQRRQGGADRGHLVLAADRLCAVAVAVDRQQHRGLDLAPPVDDAARAELGGARRPDRPQAGGGEEGDDRLGDVREIGRHPIAAADPERAQPGPAPRHVVAQLVHGQLDPLAALRQPDQGWTERLRPQGVRRVVHLRAGEPAGARHDRVGERGGDRRAGLE